MQRWRSHLDLADLMRCPETKSARDGSLECGRRDAEPMQKRCQLDKGHEGDCIFDELKAEAALTEPALQEKVKSLEEWKEGALGALTIALPPNVGEHTEEVYREHKRRYEQSMLENGPYAQGADDVAFVVQTLKADQQANSGPPVEAALIGSLTFGDVCTSASGAAARYVKYNLCAFDKRGEIAIEKVGSAQPPPGFGPDDTFVIDSRRLRAFLAVLTAERELKQLKQWLG